MTKVQRLIELCETVYKGYRIEKVGGSYTHLDPNGKSVTTHSPETATYRLTLLKNKEGQEELLSTEFSSEEEAKKYIDKRKK